jgi:crotonobetainyl-CoA:carnitine CoA-transferase CaiB-like acyl-CoA transferase
VELTGSTALGRVLMPGPVLHLKDYDGPVYDGVPAIGQHTAEVLEQLLHLGTEELAVLVEAGTARLG